MTEMKKILILAYDFPPYVSVGGLRPYSWYKHFTEFGVYPVLVTRQWDNKYKNSLDYIAPSEFDKTIFEKTDKGLIIKTAYKPNLANRLYLKYGNKKYTLLRKIISGYYEFAQYVFKFGPKSGLYYGADEYLKNNKVDCIIATGDPYVLFSYASALSKKYGIPWIADYRDPWSQDIQASKNVISKYWYTSFEKKILKNVTAITTVSSFFEKQIATLANDKPIYIIPNGYDEEVINKAKNVEQGTGILSFAFVGTIYKWHPIKSFFRVMSEFVLNNPEIKLCINFYGLNVEEELNHMINEEFFILKPYVKVHKKIKNDLFVSELARNNVMVLFNHYSTVGTKIYEFIGINRLILLCYTDDPEAEELKRLYFNLNNNPGGTFPQLQSELINETNSGIAVKDAQHLKTVLEKLYADFKKDGYIKCEARNADQFSRRIQVKNLSDLIYKITK